MTTDIRCQRRQSDLCDNFPHILVGPARLVGDFGHERFRRGQRPACYESRMGCCVGSCLGLGGDAAEIRLPSTGFKAEG